MLPKLINCIVITAIKRQQNQRHIIGRAEYVLILMMGNNKGKNIQSRVENLLRDNVSTSYSKEEIINLLSYEGIGTQEELEKILGEIEVWRLHER